MENNMERFVNHPKHRTMLLDKEETMKEKLINMNKIVFKAVVGSHNYNLSTPVSDTDYKIFVLPTFEDLYYGKVVSESTISDNEDYETKDIRLLSSLLRKANPSYLEALFTTEVNVTKGFSYFTDKLYGLKSEICKGNLPALYNATLGMMRQKLKYFDRGTSSTQKLVDEFGFDTKNFSHILRLERLLKVFLDSDFKDYEKSLFITDESEVDYFKNLKLNGAGLGKENAYSIALRSIKSVEELALFYHSKEVNNKVFDHVDSLVKKLVKENI